MRNRLFPISQTNDPCADPEWNNCLLTDRKTSSTQSSSFTNCNFSSCNNKKNSPQGHGGAISYSVANGKLTVTLCYFYNCIAYQKEGGAIDARNADDVTVTLSAFVKCHADSIGDHASGGGGINLRSIQSQPYLKFCSFISCTSSDDGGGVAIWSSKATNTLFCSECRYVLCSTPNSNPNQISPYAGGIILWNNNNILKCSNSLFASNTGWLGGAYATCNVTLAPNYILSFSFFNNNTGTCGNDATFYSFLPDNEHQAFLHCFSTTPSNRIGYLNNTWQTTKVDWLPLGCIYFEDSSYIIDIRNF